MTASNKWVRRMLSRLNGFTLIEMLVVIAIIGLLAAMLMPALSRAREAGRRANCRSNLHQLGVAIEIYRTDNGESYPPWLSRLYPVYLQTEKSFLCPSDPSRGSEGGVPTWCDEAGFSQFVETDDTDKCQMPATRPKDYNATAWTTAQTDWPNIVALRNTSIHACSYIYEFSWAPCSWWSDFATENDKTDHFWADFDNNGYISWNEAKKTAIKGLYYDKDLGKIRVKQDQIYGGGVPMVRCFWHTEPRKDLAKQLILNLACENKNVYESTAEPGGWENALGKK